MSIEETQLEQRLRDTYVAVGDKIHSPIPAVTFLASGPVVNEPRQSHSRRRKGVVTAVAAFSAVMVVIAVAFVAVRSSSSPSSRSSRRHATLGGGPGVGESPSLGPIFPTYPNHTGAELLLAPSYVPDGYHLVVSTARDGGTSISGSPGGTNQFWVRLDEAQQRPLASFMVSWGPADLSEAAKDSGIPAAETQMFHGDALDTYRSQSVPATIAGHQGLYRAESNTVAWEQNNQLVTVTGATDSWVGRWPEHLSRDDLENIAEHLVRDPDGRYTLTDPPTGFQLSGEQPSYASDGTNPRVLAYSDGANHGFAIQLVDDTQQPPGVKLANPPAAHHHPQPTCRVHAVSQRKRTWLHRA